MHNTNSPKIVAQGVPPIILTKKLINKTPLLTLIGPTLTLIGWKTHRKFFRNFSFAGNEPDHITGKLIRFEEKHEIQYFMVSVF